MEFKKKFEAYTTENFIKIKARRKLHILTSIH